MRLRKLRRTPMTTNEIPPMPMPSPMSPRTIDPPQIRSSTSLAVSAASSPFGRAPIATAAEIAPSAANTRACPQSASRRPHLRAAPLTSPDRSRASSPSAARHTASAHSPIATSHSTTKPAGAPATAFIAPAWSPSPSPPAAITMTITPIRAWMTPLATYPARAIVSKIELASASRARCLAFAFTPSR